MTRRSTRLSYLDNRRPEQEAGEDVAAQLAVMRRYGGAWIMPSGEYHLESPTTVPDRSVQCHDLV